MDYDGVERLIAENPEKINFAPFGEGVSESWIELAEARLQVKFPPSYIWWLKNFRGGDINGDEIFSVYGIDFDTVVGGDVVYMNELRRRCGFSTDRQLVIQNNDQGEMYFFGLDEVDGNDEYPVYVDPGSIRYADNFLDFIRRKINE